MTGLNGGVPPVQAGNQTQIPGKSGRDRKGWRILSSKEWPSIEKIISRSAQKFQMISKFFSNLQLKCIEVRRAKVQQLKELFRGKKDEVEMNEMPSNKISKEELTVRTGSKQNKTDYTALVNLHFEKFLQSNKKEDLQLIKGEYQIKKNVSPDLDSADQLLAAIANQGRLLAFGNHWDEFEKLYSALQESDPDLAKHLLSGFLENESTNSLDVFFSKGLMLSETQRSEASLLQIQQLYDGLCEERPELAQSFIRGVFEGLKNNRQTTNGRGFFEKKAKFLKSEKCASLRKGIEEQWNKEFQEDLQKLNSGDGAALAKIDEDIKIALEFKLDSNLYENNETLSRFVKNLFQEDLPKLSSSDGAALAKIDEDIRIAVGFKVDSKLYKGNDTLVQFANNLFQGISLKRTVHFKEADLSQANKDSITNTFGRVDKIRVGTELVRKESQMTQDRPSLESQSQFYQDSLKSFLEKWNISNPELIAKRLFFSSSGDVSMCQCMSPLATAVGGTIQEYRGPYRIVEKDSPSYTCSVIDGKCVIEKQDLEERKTEEENSVTQYAWVTSRITIDPQDPSSAVEELTTKPYGRALAEEIIRREKQGIKGAYVQVKEELDKQMAWPKNEYLPLPADNPLLVEMKKEYDKLKKQ